MLAASTNTVGVLRTVANAVSHCALLCRQVIERDGKTKTSPVEVLVRVEGTRETLAEWGTAKACTAEAASLTR